LRAVGGAVRIVVMRVRLAFVLLVCSLGLVAAGCGGGDEGDSGASPPPVESSTTGGETGDATNGEEVFATAGCGGCHTFAKAGSNGAVGPNLDDLAPSYEAVVDQVTEGGGGMPSFADQLSAQEIRDVAAFVSGSRS
jgi:mono/diheme cytochrome c family protein